MFWEYGHSRFLSLAKNFICHIQAMCRRLAKRAGKASAIAHGIHALAAVQGKIGACGPGGIIFAFYAVQKRVIIHGARGNFVQRGQCFHNIIQLPLGQAKA